MQMPGRRAEGWDDVLRVVFALVFATAVAVFALQNGQPVEVRFLGARASVSLALLILGSLTAGALAAGVPGLARVVRQGRLLREQGERVRRLQAELAAAREAKAPPPPGQG